MLEKITNIVVQDIQVDEIRGYVFKKEGHKWNYAMRQPPVATS
jgi:hypothetical protein